MPGGRGFWKTHEGVFIFFVFLKSAALRHIPQSACCPILPKLLALSNFFKTLFKSCGPFRSGLFTNPVSPMRKFTVLSTLLLFVFSAFPKGANGQILEPVKWDMSLKQTGDNDFELTFTAKIDDGWSVYSQDIEGEDGPVPTTFYFDDGAHFQRIGKVAESPENRKTLHDAVFDMEVTKFHKKATFTQKVKIADGSKPVAGYLEYMTCDDTRCLPPTEVDFSFDLKPTVVEGELKGAEGSVKKPETKPAEKTQKADQTSAVAKPEKTPTKEKAIAETAPAEDHPETSGGLEDPVTWTVGMEKMNDTEYLVNFKADIAKGWYVYSQNIEEDGPEPTIFWLDENSPGELMGKADEVSSHKVSGFDKIFEMEVTKYKEEVTFSQKIKVADAAKPITGFLGFMTCDNSRCLPPAEVPFKVAPASLVALIGDAAEEETASNTGEVPAIASITDLAIDKSQQATCGEVIEAKDKSLWGTFLLGIFGGLLALLTPCVWPMIPLTVSFFTKGSGNKSKGLFNAFMYGFYILAVYVLLSVPFHLLDSLDPDILNSISTNTWLNVAFFAIFIFFAFSFFGYYEITLPSSWMNKSSKAEGIGGALGIFFMALTLALVSFSCTGPILGSLLAGTLSSNAGTNPATLLTAGMAGFGFALALPFGLFAAFPSWLNSLPKSGGWMTTVKVVLGFLELALALKFLSNADLVNKWGFLKIELFLGLWIIIFLLLAIYLIGKIRFPHDGPMKKIPLPRLGLAILSLAFVIYLATGFRYKPLTLLSGLAPPVCYSWFNPCDCPQNLECYKDFYDGLAYAKKVNKPILVDFTGHACVNCRKMEETVWPEKEVHGIIDDNYVLVSLYVDEKIALPEDKQITVTMSNGKKRKLRKTGDQWQVLQIEEFQANTQPYYVLLSPDGKLLNQPVGYTPDKDEYANFLECGLEQFKKLEADGKLLGEN